MTEFPATMIWVTTGGFPALQKSRDVPPGAPGATLNVMSAIWRSVPGLRLFKPKRSITQPTVKNPAPASTVKKVGGPPPFAVATSNPATVSTWEATAGSKQTPNAIPFTSAVESIVIAPVT